MSVILIHSTCTARNNFKFPMPGMSLPSQRGKEEAQIFSWDLFAAYWLLICPSHTRVIVKTTLTSQIHTIALPELPFMVYGKQPYYNWPGNTAKHGHLQSRNILSIFMKQSRLLQTVIHTLNETFSTCKLFPVYKYNYIFKFMKWGIFFFILSHLNRISERCWGFPSVNGKFIYSLYIIFISLSEHAIYL